MNRVAEDIIRRADGRKIAIYGSGFYGRNILELLSHVNINVDFFVDRKNLFFTSVYGRAVLPKEILNHEEHFVVISSVNTNTANSIRSTIINMGFKKEDYFCFFDDADRDLDFFGVTVGRRSSFITPFIFPYSEFIHVFSDKRLKKIGRFTHIDPNAILGTNVSSNLSVCNDFYDIVPTLREVSVNQMIIGNDVWIGSNTFINASKVKNIGDGAIIGAGAVVLEDVPPYAIVAGVPAKVKKYRFTQEQIEILTRVQWWNWNDETILENEECFSNTDLFFRKFG